MKKFNHYKVDYKGFHMNVPEDFIVTCLRSAIIYCSNQFNNSGIDWLPSITDYYPHLTEADKYKLLIDFTTKLCLTDDLVDHTYD